MSIPDGSVRPVTSIGPWRLSPRVRRGMPRLRDAQTTSGDGRPQHREDTVHDDEGVTRLDQYMILLVRGEPLAFRVAIQLTDRGGDQGIVPTVSVHFVSRFEAGLGHTRNTWVFFSQQLQRELLQSLETAFRSSGL